ncbi:hypothetical protein CE91St41_26780 [Oscillospiraceae bacterium]|nr:hypothetical protein CE91St40_10760 [Oscillospiraceae bacterium]BDF75789.1 hypothetical protein CE91St41_26780 [Oscillospiraceae bacterium]
MEKQLEELTLADDYLFCAVMRDPSICKHFLGALGLEGDTIDYPDYIDPSPPAYAPRTVRANLLRDGKVVYVTEIYLLHNVSDCEQVYAALRAHEDAIVWELVLGRGLAHVKNIRQICITDNEPCGHNVARYDVALFRKGLHHYWDCPLGIVLCSNGHVLPNTHPDVLALLALLRGGQPHDNAFAARINAVIDNIKIAPWSGDLYQQWLEEVRRYEQG